MPLPKTLPAPSGGDPGSQQSKRSGRILGERYKVERRLGSGNFAVAHLVTDLKAAGELRVVKELPVRDIEPGETVDAAREAKLLSKLDHPNIVKFHDSFVEEDCFCLVTEYCEGGDLDDKIKKWRQSERQFDEQLILAWFVQLVMAVQYLHERRVLHRDLKARNIFLKNNMIKLGDFGISRILMGTSEYASTFAGTPYYMSPEVLKRENYNSKSDIWSLGVVLYELCCLKHAFHGKSFMDVLTGIVHGDTPTLPSRFHPSLQSLFSRMLEKDPQRRPSAVEVLKDPYISGHLQDLLSKMTHKAKSGNAESDAQEILHALGSNRRRKKAQSPPAEKTPRQQLLERKQQKADKEAERLKELAREKLAENRQRYSASKQGQHQYVPPWVQEHPDVFSDSAFSITSLSNSSPVSSLSPSSPPCEVAQYAVPQADDIHQKLEEQSSAAERRESWRVRHKGGPVSAWNEIPNDPQAADTYYTQVDTFESFESDSENDYDALIDCMEGALDLSETGDSCSITEEEEALSAGIPAASAEHKRKKLKADAERALGVEQFKRVYDFLKMARKGDQSRGKPPITDENIVQNELRKLCDQPRNCFLVDQLIFMEDMPP